MIVFDRLLATEVKFDRFVDLASAPFIESITGAQDGQPLTIAGTNFSGSGNTSYAGVPDDESETPLEIAVDTQSTTEIVTDPLDATFFWLTRTTPIFVRNSSGIASNVVSVTLAPKATERVFAVSQEFLGDASSRIESEPPLALGDEIRIRNVTGAAISDPNISGQGAFDVDDAVTEFEAGVFDGDIFGGWALQSIENLVTTALVPDVANLTTFAAQAAVQAVGLLISVVASVPHASVPAGAVIAQFPAAGTELPLGGTVELTISLGALVTIVPNLAGLSQAEAESIRTAAGLTGTVRRVIDGNNTGTVLNQSIAPGTVVDLGSALDLAVSSNLMPDLIGLLIQNATAVIAAAGLSLNEAIAQERNPLYAAGEVSAQSPAADAVVAPDDPVTLTISLGAQVGYGGGFDFGFGFGFHLGGASGGGGASSTIWDDIWDEDLWADIWAEAA